MWALLARFQGGDDLGVLHPLVDAELVPDVRALEDHELLAELLTQLPLPLEGQVGRAHQHAVRQAAQLQLADEQAGHDRLAGARIVRQEEPYARELQKVLVDGFELGWIGCPAFG